MHRRLEWCPDGSLGTSPINALVLTIPALLFLGLARRIATIPLLAMIAVIETFSPHWTISDLAHACDG
jgi:hypothetical protein